MYVVLFSEFFDLPRENRDEKKKFLDLLINFTDFLQVSGSEKLASCHLQNCKHYTTRRQITFVAIEYVLT